MKRQALSTDGQYFLVVPWYHQPKEGRGGTGGKPSSRKEGKTGWRKLQGNKRSLTAGKDDDRQVQVEWASRSLQV